MNTLPNQDFALYFRDLMNGKPHQAISPGLGFAEEMHALFDDGEQGIPLMWDTGHGFKIRRKEVTVVSGINGHGKSNWMGQVLLDLCKHGEVCCNLSMEMPPGRTLQRQCIQAVGNGAPSFDYRQRFLQWTYHNLYLSDFDRPMVPNGILGAVAWAAIERKCTQIVIDSLMKCGIAQDDHAGQKAFMNSLTEFAKALNVHIWVVAHGRKRDDELKIMDKFDVAGSADITNLADNVITIFRNKRRERLIADGVDEVTIKGKKHQVADLAAAIARCDKQRHGSWEGSVQLGFHRPSGQFVHKGQDRPMDILKTILDKQESWTPEQSQ